VKIKGSNLAVNRLLKLFVKNCLMRVTIYNYFCRINSVIKFSKNTDDLSSQTSGRTIKLTSTFGSSQVIIPKVPAFVQLESTADFGENYFVSSYAKLKSLTSNLRNAILGVSYGFFIKFSFKGVGFKLHVVDRSRLALDLGCSHFFIFRLPSSVFVKKIRKYEFVAFSNDKALLGFISNQIQMLRYPDVYKGKGIHFVGEQLFMKSRNKDAKRR